MNSTPSKSTLQALVGGMDCPSCARTIESSLQQLPGVTEASVSFATGRLHVSYDPQLVSETAIHERLTALGYTLDIPQAPKPKTLQALVGGIDCPSCAKTIQVNLVQIPGVEKASVNLVSGKLTVSYDPLQVEEGVISDRIIALGYTVEFVEEFSCVTVSSPSKERTHHKDLTGWRFWVSTRRGQSIILSGLGLLLGFVSQQLDLSIWIARAFYGMGMVVAGWPIARAGWLALISRQADMNLLMTLSAIGAVILGDWFEGALVVFLFALGTTLQSLTFGRTRNAIRALIDLRPPTATVKRGDLEVSVPVEDIQIGEILTIRPGQRVALDGIVLSGHSAIDQSPITGESIPEDKEKGDRVFAGTLNQTGFLEVKVTQTTSDTTLARIIHLVEQAQGSRAQSQQWVDRFAAIYTPVVLLVAICIALIPPLAFAQVFSVWIYRALVMLVIACPCALVISTPVSIVSAIGAATRKGVLIKWGNALETAERMSILAFDKTGTLTQGTPVVQKVYDFGEISSTQVLMIAACLEQQSEHPFARAIVTHAQAQGIELHAPEKFQALPGKGTWAKFGERVYFVGNRSLFIEHDLPLPPEVVALLDQIESQGQTPVLVGTSPGVLGVVALADGLRLEAGEAIRLLKQVDLKHLVMFTGDRTPVAQEIASQVGISQYRAQLLPEDKLQEIERLRRSGVVGMVGDGINDPPALAAADVSFAV